MEPTRLRRRLRRRLVLQGIASVALVLGSGLLSAMAGPVMGPDDAQPHAVAWSLIGDAGDATAAGQTYALAKAAPTTPFATFQFASGRSARPWLVAGASAPGTVKVKVTASKDGKPGKGDVAASPSPQIAPDKEPTPAPKPEPKPKPTESPSPRPEPSRTPTPTPEPSPTMTPSPSLEDAPFCDFDWRAGPDQVEALIRCVAERWEVPGGPDKAVAVARCESGLNPRAVGPNDLYLGIYQQHREYWPARATQYGFEGVSAFNARANIIVSIRMASEGGWGPWSGCA